VTNRVAGFICQYIFCEHESTVTSLAVVGREHVETGTYLVGSTQLQLLIVTDVLIISVACCC